MKSKQNPPLMMMMKNQQRRKMGRQYRYNAHERPLNWLEQQQETINGWLCQSTQKNSVKNLVDFFRGRRQEKKNGDLRDEGKNRVEIGRAHV